MSQFVLDDQLDPDEVHGPIARWATARFLREFRPSDVIKDDRTPTFLTIDSGFWNRKGRDRRTCILVFALRADEQGEIPTLLRRLWRLPEFKTRAARMGKVARVSRDHVSWWQLGDDNQHTVRWRTPVRSRRQH